MPLTVLKFTSKVPMIDSQLDPASIDWVYATPVDGAATPTLAADVSVAIQHFYRNVPTGGVGGYFTYLSQSIVASGPITWTAYDITTHLNGSPHGAPINSNSYTLGSVSSTAGPMPEGVAASLSFRRDYGTDVEFLRDPVTHKIISRPRGQDRGRIFLGPLAPNAFATDSTTHRTTLSATFMADMLKSLHTANTITDSASHVWTLQQWSRKKASIAPLVLAWMDDRPDYQRRRADQSSTRQSMTFP